MTTASISYGVNVGDNAPSISLLDESGKKWKSSPLLGKKNLVVFFYPAAMTGGCTKQACAYQDSLNELAKLDVQVVGICGDYSKNLSLFKKSEDLNFSLLSDPDGKTAKAFGVPLSKGGEIRKFISGERFSLQRGVTAKRWTFLIGKNGKIIYKNDKVNPSSDSASILNFLNQLK